MTRNRVTVLLLAVAVWATVIVVRLHQLQIIRADDLRAQARRQHEQQIQIEGRRGTILDRSGHVLAVSLETYSLYAHPARIERPEEIARRLAPVLGVPQGKLLEKFRSDAPFVWLARRLDAGVATAVKGLGLPLGPGRPMGFENESKRSYPQGSLAAHVIGFANVDQVGVEGIEHRFDERLRGDSSTYLAVRDGRGGVVLQLVRPPAREADDVVLTLDLVLQHMVERELEEAIAETRARSASAILLDPTSGEVLALANRPTADLNRYGKATPEERRNRAVVDLFEPGSTFKVVTAAAGLDHQSVHPGDLFHCENGTYAIAGRRVRDHHPYGLLTFAQVLERSSNIGMIKACRRLSDEVLSDYIHAFGFGRRTGIELPGEAAGIVADAGRWTLSTHVSVSFGHEIGVTALQMASAMAALANDGVLVPPRIVLGARDASGGFHPAPSGEPRRVISSQTARTLVDLLEGVVVRGTGKQAAVPGYRLAGKTGTAQKVIPGVGYSSDQFVASFAGFGPARSPRLAVLVTLDSPRGGMHTGGLAAAPVVSRIMADALAYLRVTPDEDPLLIARRRRADEDAKRAWRRKAKEAKKNEKEPMEPEKPIATVAGQVPDLRGMSLREAVAELVARRYSPTAAGSGIVVAQTPPPGTVLEEGGRCSLQLASGARIDR